MKRLFAITMVGLLLFAGSVQGVSAAKVCSMQSISCVSATELRQRGMADLAKAEADIAALSRQRAAEADAARYTGLAAYYSERAAWGPRADAARYQALADYYATLTWDATTLARTRGVAALYSR
ncbi:MAG: hypothetical protein MUF84_12615 [Anaerolineae bacterium]|nr:hypothetical protein [Anaerolineae bacterium]